MPASKSCPELWAAAQDLRYLLARGYPRQRSLDMVGDRHRLEADDRQILRRGVLAPQDARARAAKRVALDGLRAKPVSVDGHNVLITLESALLGARLVLADDGWLRDISQVGRNHRPGQETLRAAGMMVKALKSASCAKAQIWLDAPLPKSGELAGRIRELMSSAGLLGSARAAPVPENEIFAQGGVYASSDTEVIDRAEMALDLAGEIIRGLAPRPVWETLG